MKRPILVTGAAGFIGATVCKRLLAEGESVIGIDNINDYYDPGLKISRLDTIKHNNWEFAKLDISHRYSMSELFAKYKPCRVVHLAAQAGVRYSIENPSATSRPIWLALGIFWKSADIMKWNIWCTHPAVLFMGVIPTCRFKSRKL